MKTVLVEIRWRSPEDGGRKTPFAGDTYRPTIKWDDETMEQWRRCAWDVVLADLDKGNASNRVAATMRSIAEEAPQELFEQGNRFGLYEGARRVADGLVIEVKTE